MIAGMLPMALGWAEGAEQAAPLGRAVIGGLAAAVILINKTHAGTEDDGYVSPIQAGSIDQESLERIQTLHSTDQPSPTPALPGGRINAFAE